MLRKRKTKREEYVGSYFQYTYEVNDARYVTVNKLQVNLAPVVFDPAVQYLRNIAAEALELAEILEARSK